MKKQVASVCGGAPTAWQGSITTQSEAYRTDRPIRAAIMHDRRPWTALSARAPGRRAVSAVAGTETLTAYTTQTATPALPRAAARHCAAFQMVAHPRLSQPHLEYFFPAQDLASVSEGARARRRRRPFLGLAVCNLLFTGAPILGWSGMQVRSVPAQTATAGA